MADFCALLFAQVTKAASATAAAADNPDAASSGRPGWTILVFYALIFVMVYFAFFRPQIQTKIKQEETIKSAKTGDKIITSSGIHGVITNVKESTVIVKVSDNVKLEIEKSHIDKITRPASATSDPEQDVTATVS